jgi:hypothetical protein
MCSTFLSSSVATRFDPTTIPSRSPPDDRLGALLSRCKTGADRCHASSKSRLARRTYAGDQEAIPALRFCQMVFRKDLGVRIQIPAQAKGCEGSTMNLSAVVTRCLRKSRVDRFQTMSEVRKALEQVSTTPTEEASHALVGDVPGSLALLRKSRKRFLFANEPE